MVVTILFAEETKNHNRIGLNLQKNRTRSSLKITFFLICFAVVVVFESACESQKPVAPLKVPAFDKHNAFAHLTNQVAFGARVPGSEAHAACLAYLDSTLNEYAESVVQQSFEHTIEQTGETVQLTNLIASFGTSIGQRVLLAAHWDCRPWADSEIDSVKAKQPVPGANDGASGVAVLLEIARILKNDPPPVGVDIIFFDGEDFGIHGRDETWAVGAQHFASKKDPRYTPQIGLLLDMIGDKNLKLMKEGYSMHYAPGVVDFVWSYASRLGISEFVAEETGPITDDHLPLLKAGIPCINLIDLDYAYHHTVEDTPDKCSPESLEKVGKVALAVVYNPQ